MKTQVAVLIILSFMQSTIIPVNLVLIVLICRSYIRPDRANFFLAFAFGLFISHLDLTPLGFQSLIYLLVVASVESLSKFKLATNPLLIVPLSLGLLSASQISISFFTHSSLELFPKVFVESLLSFPILFLVRLWEERFIVAKEIKLKI